MQANINQAVLDIMAEICL